MPETDTSEKNPLHVSEVDDNLQIKPSRFLWAAGGNLYGEL